MRNMQCKECLRLIDEGEDLSQITRAAKHLKTCSNCSRAYGQVKDISRQIDQICFDEKYVSRLKKRIISRFDESHSSYFSRIYLFLFENTGFSLVFAVIILLAITVVSFQRYNSLSDLGVEPEFFVSFSRSGRLVSNGSTRTINSQNGKVGFDKKDFIELSEDGGFEISYLTGTDIEFEGTGKFKAEDNSFKVIRADGTISFSDYPAGYELITPMLRVGLKGTTLEMTVTDFSTKIVVKSGSIEWKDLSNDVDNILSIGEEIHADSDGVRVFTQSALSVSESKGLQEDEVALEDLVSLKNTTSSDSEQIEQEIEKNATMGYTDTVEGMKGGAVESDMDSGQLDTIGDAF